MAKQNKKENTITVNDKEYKIEDMDQSQKTLLAHISDLKRKIDTSKFNLQQLEVGQSSFIKLLNDSLNKEKESANRPE
tara:strand:- start:524 stop:757 length:234 start_codon:yes stop_codon:yes gene_type:complete